MELSKGTFENSISDGTLQEEIHRGDVLADEYEVLSEAVCGHLSSVWRVRRRGQDRDMAMIRPGLNGTDLRSEEIRRSFADGAGIWIDLGRHPNIAACHEIREIGGEPTVFCEWMEGGSLKDRIADSSLYEGDGMQVQLRILEIASMAARGLQFVHSRGGVHCDVNPSNILLSEDNKVVRITGFGLSRRIAKRTDDTPEGGVSGFTAAYCAKEQLEGQPVKPWMDIYSWALTVLEMYLGNRVWKTGDEAREHFEECAGLCRVPLPRAMKKLLTGCLKWKINDFSMVLKDLDRMPAALEEEAAAPQQEMPAENAEPDREQIREPVSESREENAGEPVKIARTPGLFERLRKIFSGGKSECRRGNHTWNGCVCSVCGTEQHDYELVSIEETENGGCCWSVSDPCIGPHCGTPCDSYYPGREGAVTKVWRCRRCGHEKTESSSQ